MNRDYRIWSMYKSALKFRSDELFKIVQFTDLHWESLGDQLDEWDQRTRMAMKKILDIEKPDLVVFTGDIMTSGSKSPIKASKTIESIKDALKIILKPVLDSMIPWTLTLGNHEHSQHIESNRLLRIISELPMCQIKLRHKNSLDSGNYMLKIKGSSSKSSKWTLYFFDSGCKHDYPGRSYGWIEQQQINWYDIQSISSVKKAGKVIPALAFLHIPLCEYEEVWNTEICYGIKNDQVQCPILNTGLFSKMVLNRDIKGIFVGHDHSNDYMGNLHGIELCYGRTTGHRQHQDNSYILGARIIQLNENENEFQTWIRLEDGMMKEPEIHYPTTAVALGDTL